jgi:hypothetical protein
MPHNHLVATILYQRRIVVGYRVKLQKVERPTNKSYYINFPAAIAESAKMEKGEELEWLIEDRNTFLLKRVRQAKSNLKY